MNLRVSFITHSVYMKIHVTRITNDTKFAQVEDLLYLVCSNRIVHEPCWIHVQSNYKEHTCVHLDQIHHFHTCYNFHISLKYISPTIFWCFILANDYLGPAVDGYVYQYGMINWYRYLLIKIFFRNSIDISRYEKTLTSRLLNLQKWIH